jgi:hypothetical protein
MLAAIRLARHGCEAAHRNAATWLGLLIDVSEHLTVTVRPGSRSSMRCLEFCTETCSNVRKFAIVKYLLTNGPRESVQTRKERGEAQVHAL